MKLIKNLWRLRKQRNEYYIEPKVEFVFDTEYYSFYLLPTIHIQPWIYRHPDWPVISFAWLNLGINIGIWRNRKDKND